MRTPASLGFLCLLAACSREEPSSPVTTTGSQATPRPAAEGVAYLELVEENTDTLDIDLPINDQRIRALTLIDAGTELRVPREVALGEALEAWGVEGASPRLEAASIALVHRRVYRGRGRRGEITRYRFSGETLEIPAPPQPGGLVGGGIESSFAAVMSRVRLWPSGLRIRRDGEAVLVRCGSAETRVEPGKESVLVEATAKAGVVQESPDGAGEGAMVHPGIRQKSLGERFFSTRLTLRNLGMRKCVTAQEE